MKNFNRFFFNFLSIPGILIVFMLGMSACTKDEVINNEPEIISPNEYFTIDGITYHILDADSFDNSQPDDLIVEVISPSSLPASRNYPSTTYEGDLKLPQQVSFDNRTYELVAIGRNAFAESDIASIYIPSSVRLIDEKAFYNCLSLKKVEMENSVETIGDFAFSGCNFLEEINISRQLKELGEYAFNDCLFLTEIDLPDTLEEMGGGALSHTGISTIEIPKGLETLRYATFSGCMELTHITIPENIKNLEASVFEDCRSLEKVDFLGNISTLPRYCFAQCSSLTTFEVPESVITIDIMCFSECTKLSSISLGSNFQNIEGGAFYNDKLLKTIIIRNPEPPTYALAYYKYGALTVDYVYDTFVKTYEIAVYVPEIAMEAYRETSWKQFYLQPMSALEY